MPKAINWPTQCGDVIQNDPDTITRMALRLNPIYFEHRYWSEGDVVDLRVNHEVCRQAVILGEMRLCAIQDLSTDDLKKFPLENATHESIVTFLKEAYPEQDRESPVTLSTQVSVVYYRPLALEAVST